MDPLLDSMIKLTLASNRRLRFRGSASNCRALSRRASSRSFFNCSASNRWMASGTIVSKLSARAFSAGLRDVVENRDLSSFQSSMVRHTYIILK